VENSDHRSRFRYEGVARLALIELDQVSRIYNPGKPDEIVALDSVSLLVDKQDVLVLHGPSGSGKTTLLSTLGCMARPTSGNIIVAGKNVAKLPERFLAQIRRKRFGFIFQHFNLIRELSVIDNILLPLIPEHMGIRAVRERAQAVAEKLDITKKLNVKVNKLSGGEQQRVAIARSLINEPEIIIADEPTAHLDRKLAQEFLAILQQLNDDGKTIVIATHDSFVYDNVMVSAVGYMEEGKIGKVVKR